MDDAARHETLSEDRAAQLLERAAKLDVRGPGRVSIDELREVAVEAGISAESFDAALAELRAGQPGAPRVAERAHSKISGVVRRAGIVAVGSLLGVLTAIMADMGMDGVSAFIFTMVIATLVAAWLAVGRRSNRELLDFEMDLGALWAGLTFWLMMSNPGDAGQVLEVMMPAGALGSVLGGVIVATGSDEEELKRLPEGG